MAFSSLASSLLSKTKKTAVPEGSSAASRDSSPARKSAGNGLELVYSSIGTGLEISRRSSDLSKFTRPQPGGRPSLDKKQSMSESNISQLATNEKAFERDQSQEQYEDARSDYSNFIRRDSEYGVVSMGYADAIKSEVRNKPFFIIGADSISSRQSTLTDDARSVASTSGRTSPTSGVDTLETEFPVTDEDLRTRERRLHQKKAVAVSPQVLCEKSAARVASSVKDRVAAWQKPTDLQPPTTKAAVVSPRIRQTIPPTSELTITKPAFASSPMLTSMKFDVKPFDEQKKDARKCGDNNSKQAVLDISKSPVGADVTLTAVLPSMFKLVEEGWSFF